MSSSGTTIPKGLSEWAGGVLVARSTFSDTARRRGSWTITLLTGALFALLVVGSGAVSERMQGRAESISFRVAASGDTQGAAGLLGRIGTDQLLVAVMADSASEVAESRATVGLKFPEGVDSKLSRGERVELAVYYRGGSNTSREAYNTLLLRLQAIEVDLVHAPVDLSPEVRIEQRQVHRDERVNRLQFARTLGALAALLCLGAVSSVSAVLGRSRERRSLEPLLLLPLSRHAVVTATAVGVLAVAVLQLLAAVSLLVVSSTLPVVGLGLPVQTMGSIAGASVLGVLLLGGLACCAGCVAGVLGTGSDDAVGLGDFLALPFVGVGVWLFLQPSVPSAAWSFALPIVGPTLLLRDGVGGELSLVDGVVAVLTTALWCSTLLWLAARRIGGERVILRGTT